MKELLASLLVCGLVALHALCPPSAQAAGGPDRQARLLMGDTLMTLWSLGMTESHAMSQEELSRAALYFALAGPGAECGAERGLQPEYFQGVPEEYRAYIPREAVEHAAESVFNQKLRQHVAPVGTMLGHRGYYIDFQALFEKTDYLSEQKEDGILPGFAEIRGLSMEDDRTCAIAGRLRRFKNIDGQEILWKAAAFRATFHRTGTAWVLTAFTLEEEAMG